MAALHAAGLPGACRCMDGFRGPACEERWVAPGHGACDAATGACACGPVAASDAPAFHGQRWTGPACEQRECLRGCSGNGVCDAAAGTCACFAGWAGPACGRAACRNECSFHGRCVLAQLNVSAADAEGEAEAGAADAAGVGLLAAVGRMPGEQRRARPPAAGAEAAAGAGAEVSPAAGAALSSASAAASAAAASGGPPRFAQGRAQAAGREAETPTTAAAAAEASAAAPSTSSAPLQLVSVYRAQCACDVGWSGPACERRECPGHCSGHGRCLHETGACSCDAGFYGADCAVNVAPGGSAVIVDVNDAAQTECGAAGCGGPAKGLCVAKRCLCKAQFSGDHCELRACPSGCRGHGVCEPSTGECACVAGWAGEDCGRPQAGPARPDAPVLPTPSASPAAPAPSVPPPAASPTPSPVPAAALAASAAAAALAAQSAAIAAAVAALQSASPTARP